VAERAKDNAARTTYPRTRTFGNAAATATQRFSWLWSAESLWRLLLSAILATALWLYVTNKQQPGFIDFGPAIPITTANLGQGLTVTNSLGTLKVRYRPSDPNQYVAPGAFHASVDLIGKRPGDYVGLKVTVVGGPGIQVLRFTPDLVSVAIERKLTKSVPLSVKFFGNRQPPSGYQAGNVNISPNVVTVTGPKSLVSQVSQAYINLDLSTAQTTIVGPYVYQVADAQGVAIQGQGQLTLNPKAVQVTVPIHAVSSFKTLPLLVPIHGSPKPGYGVVNITVSPSSITAKGSPSVLSRLTSISTLPVSVSHRGQGSFRTKVKVNLPNQIASATKTATVVVQLGAVESSSSIQVGVTPVNVPTFVSARTAPALVLVTLIGPSSGLKHAARSITATVNVGGFAAGTYRVAPQVTVPPGFKVGNIYPQLVTVTLR
jgi:YbbR domain-containing protein